MGSWKHCSFLAKKLLVNLQRSGHMPLHSPPTLPQGRRVINMTSSGINMSFAVDANMSFGDMYKENYLRSQL